jgi:hypothetical protein
MTTIIQDPAHMQTVKDFADRTNQRAQLDEKINFLESMCDRNNWNLFLYPDFVPMSFYFQIYPAQFTEIPQDWQQHRVMNGGIIYHGRLEDNSQPETFAVTLTESNSWSIHT